MVDPRTILPHDEDTILSSEEKTVKGVIGHETPVFSGVISVFLSTARSFQSVTEEMINLITGRIRF